MRDKTLILNRKEATWKDFLGANDGWKFIKRKI